MNYADKVAIVCFVGGVVGTLLHAILTTSRPSWTRITLGNAILGGLVGAVFPSYVDAQLPTTLFLKAVAMAIMTYAQGDALINLALRSQRIAGVLGTTQAPPKQNVDDILRDLPLPSAPPPPPLRTDPSSRMGGN